MMMRTTIKRRDFVKLASAVAFAVPILQACGGTASVTASTSAAASASVSTAASSQGSSTVAAATSAPAQGKVALSIGTEDGSTLDWQRVMAQEWAQQHPQVNLRIDIVPYAQAEQKTLVEMAAGTLQDVSYAPCKWWQLPAYKGAYIPLDSYIHTTDPGMDDFFPGAVQNGTFEGKIYTLPNDFDNGNYSVVLLNLDLFAKKGVTPPTNDWTVTDYANIAAQLTDPANKIFGTDYIPGTYYDFSQISRNWGTDILSKDGTKFQFANDPNSTAGAQWVTDLRAKLHAGPTIQDMEGTAQGIGFPGGKLAMSNVDINLVLGNGDTVGNKFKWEAVLFPKGPSGVRAYYIFSTGFAISSHSKSPELAYDLIVKETSKEAGVYGVVHNHFAPNPRKSVFTDPQVQQVNPIFSTFYSWLNSQTGPTQFPLPNNLRYAELETKWENVTPPLFYGTSPFASTIQSVQQACQAILDEPRP